MCTVITEMRHISSRHSLPLFLALLMCRGIKSETLTWNCEHKNENDVANFLDSSNWVSPEVPGVNYSVILISCGRWSGFEKKLMINMAEEEHNAVKPITVKADAIF